MSRNTTKNFHHYRNNLNRKKKEVVINSILNDDKVTRLSKKTLFIYLRSRILRHEIPCKRQQTISEVSELLYNKFTGCTHRRISAMAYTRAATSTTSQIPAEYNVVGNKRFTTIVTLISFTNLDGELAQSANFNVSTLIFFIAAHKWAFPNDTFPRDRRDILFGIKYTDSFPRFGCTRGEIILTYVLASLCFPRVQFLKIDS